MLRQASRAMSRATRARTFSTEVSAAAPALDSTFIDSWNKAIPNIEPPKTPSSFMTPRPSNPTSIPTKLTVNFALPYASELSSKPLSQRRFVRILAIDWMITLHLAEMVIVPATTGQMGVLPGQVATMAELKPGILSVHEGNDVTKYFLSCGFAFVHSNSVADIIAIEAVPIDQIDPEQIQKGLAEFTETELSYN
ncbi:ATP synthase subunit delta', mitochondrial-like [Rutidosis leptorrhynchoides]|uniref:ATP synthase subunit delta', mitochondrial-like n=1 Tax=Rutidosis leptorrhynchoides TaxID=125765 RepID=UPI003A99049D